MTAVRGERCKGSSGCHTRCHFGAFATMSLKLLHQESCHAKNNFPVTSKKTAREKLQNCRYFSSSETLTRFGKRKPSNRRIMPATTKQCAYYVAKNVSFPTPPLNSFILLGLGLSSHSHFPTASHNFLLLFWSENFRFVARVGVVGGSILRYNKIFSCSHRSSSQEMRPNGWLAVRYYLPSGEKGYGRYDLKRRTIKRETYWRNNSNGCGAILVPLFGGKLAAWLRWGLQLAAIFQQQPTVAPAVSTNPIIKCELLWALDFGRYFYVAWRGGNVGAEGLMTFLDLEKGFGGLSYDIWTEI